MDEVPPLHISCHISLLHVYERQVKKEKVTHILQGGKSPLNQGLLFSFNRK